MTPQWDQLFKYLLEGLAVSFASTLISKNKLNIKEIVMLGLTAAATFIVLDYFSPTITIGARQGAGFGLGHKLVTEGMDNESEESDTESEESDTESEESDTESDTESEESDTESEELDTDSNVIDSNVINSNVIDSIHSNPQVPYIQSQPYKLVDGQYSHKVLLAGYNNRVKAYNNKNNHTSLASWPFNATNISSNVQSGGWAGEEALETNAQATETNTQAPETNAQAPETNAQSPETNAQATETNTQATETAVDMVIDRAYRKANYLYSGDLIDLKQGDLVLQRGTIDSQIIFGKALPTVSTNLSKLRFVHPKHKASQQTVLNYNEPVYLMHNAYFNNTNQVKHIKYGERLQSHQDGPLFRTYIISDAHNTRTGPIELGSEIILSRGDQEGDKIYLKIEDSDKTISSKNSKGEATPLMINLKRVYELHNKNQCVCSNDILYP